MTTENTLPLFVLQPVLDDQGRHQALRIAGPGSTDAEAIGRLLTEFELADAAGTLPMLLPASAIEAVAAAGVLPTGATLAVDTHQESPPPPATSSHSGPAAAVMLKLLGQVTSDADTHAIESTLKQDPQLSLQLLRLVNSAAFAPTSRIASFNQAITLLGRRQLQRWLQLLLFARGQSNEQMNPLLPRAAMRAALMEALCKSSGGSRDATDEAYMVGMFSLLEPLFGKPLASIIGTLQLAPEIALALLQHSGPLGQLLALVEAADRDDSAVAAALEQVKISNDTWCSSQVIALRWSLQISRGL